VREITPRPFAVNHVVPLLDEAAFRVTLEAKPAGKASGRLFRPRAPGRASQSSAVERARGARAKVVHQVHTVGQARRAIELGVDVIIAQGSETGGQGMALGVGAMALIPQIAEAVGPIPVLAAGGVADGRGLAAALVLGAQGANVGTRFLACKGASADEGWKRTILGAESDHAVRFEAWGDVFPPAGGGAYATVPRVLRTPFVEEWSGRSRVGRKEAERLQDAVLRAIRGRTTHELLPFTGQSAGMVHDVSPAGEIVERMVAEAERALARAEEFRRPSSA
jgi:enoyl-[acyl-carrier protein] reductase II